ncbi:MAG: hypothetical protein OXC91_03320 [Rhodobacteraceae bacterium]|nr:hypothetical protein [Paracoccaceae bacterium]
MNSPCGVSPIGIKAGVRVPATMQQDVVQRAAVLREALEQRGMLDEDRERHWLYLMVWPSYTRSSWYVGETKQHPSRRKGWNPHVESMLKRFVTERYYFPVKCAEAEGVAYDAMRDYRKRRKHRAVSLNYVACVKGRSKYTLD